MTPTHFRIVKHLTATLVSVTVVGLFVLGVDGLIGGIQRLARLFAAASPATPAAAPAVKAGATPGVAPAFIVPADEAAPGEPARRDRE